MIHIVMVSCFINQIVELINYKMETINEAATKHSLKKNTVKEIAHILSCEDFKAGVEFSQQWIKVENELPEQVEKLIGNSIKSENVLVKRKWDDTGEIAIEINCRFRPSPRIGFLWNIEYKGSTIIEWRPIERF